MDKDNIEEQKQLLKIRITDLKSDDQDIVLSTLDEINRSEQTETLPEIFKLIKKNPENEIGEKCIKMLNDLKLESGKAFIINAIQDNNLTEIRHILISSCWQNGLDFHEYIDIFTDAFISEGYLVAIEAFTVIENSIGNLDDKIVIKTINKLQQASENIASEKKPLLEELISIIKSY